MKILYRFFIAPFATLIYLSLVVPFFSKPRRLFALRSECRRRRPNTSGEWIWIHASSGEFEYAKAVIRELKGRQPSLKILVTFSSPSYEKQIGQFDLVDHFEPLPLDIPAPLTQLILKFKPKMLLIARTDLWPELLWQCRRLKVKTVIFSLAFPKPLGSLEKLWKSWILNQLDHIFVISESDKLIATTSLKINTKIDVVGDPRFDQAVHRIENSRTAGLATSNELLLLAGSTWSEDEKVLLPGILPFIQAKQIRLVIAPHEPSESHIKDLQEYFKSASVQTQLYSADPAAKGPVTIVDRIGVLAGLYPYAQLAFIGGSFKSKVHSVMEALVAGLPVFVGPYFKNNSEAVKYQGIALPGEMRAVIAVEDELELKQALQQIVDNPEQLVAVKKKITELTRLELGASQKIVSAVLGPDYLGESHEHLPTNP